MCKSGMSRYNCGMHYKLLIRWLLFGGLLAGLFAPVSDVRASQSQLKVAQSSEVTAFDLIIAMNTLRMSYGLPALVEDPIIDAVAQSTADIMAANQMSWHIGDVAGRLTAAGYGGGAKVWATENFAVGNQSIDEIMVIWSDDSHMIPAVNPAYCNVGAGVAKSPNGMTYYVLQAAYTAKKSCGEYKSPGGAITQPGGSTTADGAGGVPQWIMPVKIATPDAAGKVFHVVEAGQSLWAIAVAYQITIKDLETWNNLPKDSKLQIGQRLFVPGSNTEGYATPTPVGMIQLSTPDGEGKIIHTVQTYQTLTTIAQAYNTTVEKLLTLNGLQVDWPLQIGQKLVIFPGSITPSPTPRPLTPIERLTPASDGRYYHIIKSGESLSWIANLYDVQVADLLAWNGLNESAILQPEQKLVLQVTPPATVTATPNPATATPTVTTTPTSTSTQTPTHLITPTIAVAKSALTFGRTTAIGMVAIGLLAVGIFLVVFFSRKKV